MAEFNVGISLFPNIGISPKTPCCFCSCVKTLYRSSLHHRRSVGVEKVPAGGRISSLNPDHMKPMRKRKRKEYLSPSEEDSDFEGMVGQHTYYSSTSRDVVILLEFITGSDRSGKIDKSVKYLQMQNQ